MSRKVSPAARLPILSGMNRALATLLVLTPLQAQDDLPTMELSLDQAVRLSLNKNLELQIAELDGEISHFDQLGSWGAFDWVFDASLGLTDAEREVGGFLDGGNTLSVESEQTDLNLSLLRPLQTGGTFSASFNRGISASNSAFQNDPEQTTDTLSLVYTQPLRRGAWSEYATSVQRENELLWRRQLEIVRQTRQRIAVEVSNAYWDLVSAREQLQVAIGGVELGIRREEREQAELDAGLGTEVDVVQAQAELATREESLLQAQNAVEQRQDDLRKLLSSGEEDALWGVQLFTTTGLPVTTSTSSVPTWTAAVATAMENRPELRQRKLDVDLSQVRLARAGSDRLSGLDLQLSVNSRSVDASGGQAFEDTSSFEFPTYAATLSYNVPIGNRSARFAERAARTRVRSAQLEFDRSELDVVAEVRAAVRAVKFAAEQVVATRKSLELAVRQLDAEEALEDNDLSTTFQVLEFEQAKIEAESNEKGALASYAKALVALENAQGKLGD